MIEVKGYIKLRYIFDNHYFFILFFKGLNVGIAYNCNVNDRVEKPSFWIFSQKGKYEGDFAKIIFFFDSQSILFFINYNVFVNNITLFY